MKIYYIYLSLLFSFGILNAQDKEVGVLLENTLGWGVEYFKLPTGFAQEMTVTGVEEAYFAPGWSNPESDEMWSYIFIWKIKAENKLTIQEIEENLEIYFDGLSGIRKDTIVAPKLPTNALVLKLSEEKEFQEFSGKVRLFDRFRSQQMMTLHLKLTQMCCANNTTQLLVFRFSPKLFGEPVWELPLWKEFKKEIVDQKRINFIFSKIKSV